MRDVAKSFNLYIAIIKPRIVRFRSEFDHVTADTIQYKRFKITVSTVKVTAWVTAWRNVGY